MSSLVLNFNLNKEPATCGDARQWQLLISPYLSSLSCPRCRPRRLPSIRQRDSTDPSVNASFFGRRRTIIDQPGPAHLLHHYKNNAFGRSPETRLGGALRYWRRISNGGCDTTQPGRGSGSCPISKRTHEGKTLTPTTRRRRGGRPHRNAPGGRRGADQSCGRRG